MEISAMSPRARANAVSGAQAFSAIAERIPLQFVAAEKNRLAAERDNRTLPPFANRVPALVKSAYRGKVLQNWLSGSEITYAEARPGYEHLLDNAHRAVFSLDSADVGGRVFPAKRGVTLEGAQAALERANAPTFAAFPIAYFRAENGDTFLLFEPSISRDSQAKTKGASIRNRGLAIKFLQYMTAKHARGFRMSSVSLLSTLLLSGDSLLVDEVQVSRAEEEHSFAKEFLVAVAVFLSKGMISEKDLPGIVNAYRAHGGPVARCGLEQELALPKPIQSEGVARAVLFVESHEKKRTQGIVPRAVEYTINFAAKFF
jgi:hypothetical protein